MYKIFVTPKEMQYALLSRRFDYHLENLKLKLYFLFLYPPKNLLLIEGYNKLQYLDVYLNPAGIYVVLFFIKHP